MSRHFPVHELPAFQKGLTVGLIATPRDRFVCCSPDDSLSELSARNVEKFDFMPVVERDCGGREAPIIGVVCLLKYFHEQAPDEPVEKHMDRLDERFLIGSDASILDYLIDADKRPFRFLVASNGITGLVSLSDLHRLPVRAALFGLVTGLEMAMSDLIRKLHPHRADWERLLSSGRRLKLEEQIRNDEANDGIVDPLLYTQFCDKRTILEKSLFDSSSERDSFCSSVRRIEKLRNRLAHSNDYARDVRSAKETVETVRILLDVRARIEKVMEDRAT